MGKVDDLRAMREARYAAASRSAKAVPARSAVATVSRPEPVVADTKPTPVKAKAGKKSTLTVVSNPEPEAVETSPGAEPAALFAVPEGAAVEPEAETELCGHRAISGKTCIREAKHAEKNHKYAKS